MVRGVVSQVRNAAQKQNRLSTAVGAVLGGFVPVATWYLAHHEAGIVGWRERAALGLVAAGLAYSATTVFGWARIAFQSVPKAVGYVVLLEGSMTIAISSWLSAVALGILVLINALATACNLAEDHRETRKAERAARAPAVRAKSDPAVRKAVDAMVKLRAIRKVQARK